ncbi:MAG: hypothetical protein GY862_10225 [Gammaproteobacteria bacterium]|nr:hypothetical protein [Gammaproteobacteria bacterium]
MQQDIELIPLSELIAKVKSDLLAQVDPESEETPLLFVDEIEITARVVAKREKGESGKAGLNLSVFGLGVNAGVDSKTVAANELAQSITLKLSPLLTKAEYTAQLSPEKKGKIRATVEKGAVRSSGRGANRY